MSQEKIKNIIEAALMVSTKPFTISRLSDLFEANQTLQPERNDIRAAIEALQQDYQDRGIELVEVASGFRFHARDEYAQWVNHLFDERPPRYSRALLETLSIIAYRQPITRGEIEDIRGVSVSGTIIKTLQEREWIKVVGHRDVPGKPELLATTKAFLDYFNLKKLSDLPALADIVDFDSINPDLFEALAEKAEANSETSDEIDPETAEEIVNDSVESSDNETEAVSDNADDLVTEAVPPEETEIIENSAEEDGAKVIPFSA
ncbi:MAG: SMC-Scp complex subunit ScpB [Proteobacteria bacterium]|nr:SMC-Scp complex subunit ScpB [Pseudomonadota bacterium]